MRVSQISRFDQKGVEISEGQRLIGGPGRGMFGLFKRILRPAREFTRAGNEALGLSTGSEGYSESTIGNPDGFEG